MNFQETAQALKTQYVQAAATVADFNELYDTARASVEERIKAIEAEFQIANAELIAGKAEATEVLSSVENSLRELAIDHYNQTKEKSLDANIGVRVNTKLTYAVEDAVKWAEINAPVMIVKGIDKKAFEALPLTKEQPFVTVEETPSAVLKGLNEMGISKATA